MPETTPSQAISVTLIKEVAEWEKLQPEWEALFQISPYASFPLRFIWLRNWWRIYGPIFGISEHSLRIITIRRGKELIGILPLYQGKYPGSIGGLRRLGFLSTIGTDREEIYPDYLNLLCQPGEESNCLRAIWNTIQKLRWDTFQLVDISQHSPLLNAKEYSWSKRNIQVISSGVCPIANLEKGFENYLQRLSSNTRQQCRRHLRQANQAGIEFQLADPSNSDLFLDDLIRLHQERWTAVGKPGCFTSEKYTAFHRLMVRELIPLQQAVLARLSVEGKPLAVLYGFITHSKFDFYQSGVQRIDSGSLKSVGIIAHLLLMSRLIELGITQYDFLRGSSEYKEKLATEHCSLYSLNLWRPTGRTMIYQTSRFLYRAIRKGYRIIRQRGKPKSRPADIEIK
jgi:CelD/BcsL family acetyltransferase involved in cellulose biosynthesis